MGIARGMARLLLVEAKKRPFCGTVLQLGRQNIHFSLAELNQWAACHDVKLSANAEVGGPFDDVEFFTALGFSRVHSVDLTPGRSCDWVHDLNREVPCDFHGLYDVVFDGGTMEHVFDPVSVLKNIHRLLKVRGRVIHGSPSNNHRFDEGYYMFSPSFFWDFYSVNRYRIDTCHFLEQVGETWNIYPYPGPRSWRLVPVKSCKEPLSTFLVATKLEDAATITLPVQNNVIALNYAKKKASKEEARRLKHLSDRAGKKSAWRRLKAGRLSSRLFFWTKRKKKYKRLTEKPKPIATY